MSRYFKVSLLVMPALHSTVQAAMNQPNAKAEEPFRISGDFNDGAHGYIAIGDHLPEMQSFVTGSPDVELITEAEYLSAAFPRDAGDA